MAITIAILASLAFIGWFIARVVRGKSVSAHIISYAVACVAGIYTFAYFLAMDIPQLLKVVVSILFGVALIILAAYFQRRRQAGQQA